MSVPDLVVTSRRVVSPGGVGPAAVLVADGQIVQVVDPDDPALRRRRHPAVVDAGDLVVLPGAVDSHVHVNEPGRTAWEGFATATKAAAAGGVTTIVDMPLNSVPPTTTVAALEQKRAAAEGKVRVDVAFWGGVVPGDEPSVAALAAEGVAGFKVFLCDSGVAEYGSFAPADLDPVVARTAAIGATLVVHAEHPEVLAAAAAATAGADPRCYATWLDSRPPEAEVRAVEALVAAARRHGARVHVLHVSAAEAADVVAAARADGVAITAETCPHYLTLAAEEIADGATDHKCAPPIRGADNREQLWAALASGHLDATVSDHSPATPALKAGDFTTAWGGIASLQLLLPLVWTGAAARGHGLDALARWTASAPARIAGLARKGAIVAGADADLVVFDPDATETVDVRRLHHRHPVCPYAGQRLRGVVRATYLRGERVAADGHPTGSPKGRLLRRDAP